MSRPTQPSHKARIQPEPSCSSLNQPSILQDMPKKGVMSLRFGPDAKTLFVGAADHNLRIIGLAGDNGMQE